MPEVETTLQQTVHSLYHHHHGWLQAWLCKKLGCPQRAADLAHDAFLRLLARDEPVAIREPRAFLTRVAQRVLSNHRRRERIERAYAEVLMQLPEVLAPSPFVKGHGAFFRHPRCGEAVVPPDPGVPFVGPTGRGHPQAQGRDQDEFRSGQGLQRGGVGIGGAVVRSAHGMRRPLL
ncbi:MAG: hypothetical protein IT489_07160 [Gammaproteobacteria bacterium]|nr:hypothetical protein [Gammaproteobacteria bacterium]